MDNFDNNYLNIPLHNNICDYKHIAKKMVKLSSSCFHNKTLFSQQSMFSFLQDHKNHVFFNEISLAIIQLSDLEADLVTLMVEPEHQTKGIGSALLRLILLYLKDLNVEKLFLEVAVNNKVAIRIYNKFDFKSCGIRKNYYLEYGGLRRDASIMECNISIKNGKLNKKKLQRLYPTG